MPIVEMTTELRNELYDQILDVQALMYCAEEAVSGFDEAYSPGDEENVRRVISTASNLLSRVRDSLA